MPPGSLSNSVTFSSDPWIGICDACFLKKQPNNGWVETSAVLISTIRLGWMYVWSVQTSCWIRFYFKTNLEALTSSLRSPLPPTKATTNWPWACYLCLHVLIYKMGMKLVPLSWSCFEYSMSSWLQSLGGAPWLCGFPPALPFKGKMTFRRSDATLVPTLKVTYNAFRRWLYPRVSGDRWKVACGLCLQTHSLRGVLLPLPRNNGGYGIPVLFLMKQALTEGLPGVGCQGPRMDSEHMAAGGWQCRRAAVLGVVRELAAQRGGVD